MIITQLIVIALMLLWLYAGITKIMDVQTFSDQLAKMPFISGFHSLLSWSVPVVMLFTALLLALPQTKLLGLYSSIALLIAFVLYISSVLLFSGVVPCTCAGIKINLNWKDHLWINGTGIVLTSIAVWLERKTKIEENALNISSYTGGLT